ncbi:MAG: polyphosphate polymerase domain-containing protein [Gammaproteobacteria bacterium]|nr:polyphosphate polymerase domain-containing protein [Gammaproteobacteria bacterium]
MPAGDGLFAGLEPVPLDVVETTTVVPRRHDRKYVVAPEILKSLTGPLARDFLVLEIDGRRLFRYETCYFDDNALRCYHDHRQGRRRRYKIRARSYLDTDLHYLEVKLKALRGTTLKLRRPYRHDGGALSCSIAMDFVNSVLDEAYGMVQESPLVPTLEVQYARSTLISRTGGERVTIDRDISFLGNRRLDHVPPGHWIIETKGPRCSGQLDSLLRRLGQRPVRGCSKYCIGMGVTGQVHQINRFMPAMSRLGFTNPGSTQSAAVDASTD